LEQADGLWQLESTMPYGAINYLGDPFPGNTNNRTFNGSSVPASKDYAGSQTYVAVQNVSDSGPVMTCDLFVSPADVEDDFPESGPSHFELRQNYPNPFNPFTSIEYYLPRETWVKIEIFNVLGEKVRTLVDEKVKAGSHSVKWDGTDEERLSVSTGIYFCRLRAGDSEQTGKMILLK
jgi:hypothetical protein